MKRLLPLLALLWALPSSAAESVPLHIGTDDRYSLAPYFSYLEDATGRLSADDLLQPSSAVSFRRPEGREINFGYSRSVFWLKAVLRSDSRATERFFLEINYPTLDRVAVFLDSPDTNRRTAEAGDLLPFSSRPFRHRNLVFPLEISGTAETTLLLRVESQGSLTVPVLLWRESAFYRHSLDEYAILSAYFGVLGALFLYNLLLYVSLRKPVYLAYICFVASMTIGQLSQSGLGNEYLWGDFTAWGNVAFPLGFSATGFFGALFTRMFLGTRRNTPRLDRVIVILAAGFAFSTLSSLIVPYRATAILTSLLGVTFSAIAVAAGVVCLRKGHPGARWFLLAWTLLLGGVAMLGMRNLAWLPTTFVTSYGMQIGSALEMLLLSFALADRINHMRREKDEAQQRALEIAGEKERELALQSREWEETFNSISDMVIILGRDYRILKANRAASVFLGKQQDALVNETCRDLHHHDGCQPVLCPCRDTFGKGISATREFFEPKFGRYLEITTSPILNSEGRVTAAVHITKDVTWRKKMEEELVKTSKLDSLAVLAGGIAHDFNNMLTVIISTTTLAKMYAQGDAKVVAKIDEAEQEIIRTRELTNQLLTFAKGGAPVKRLSSFRDLLDDTVEFSLKGSNVKNEMSIAEDLWAAEIDRPQISRVVGNMVLNAAQAMPNGGTVRVKAVNAVVEAADKLPLEPGRYVRIDIEDNGAGIAAENLPNIFDPFFTTKPGGSGLGLSTSYAIVKKHNGWINVQSQPGSGSVFTMYLPASSARPGDASLSISPEMKGGGRVLLMDDDGRLLKSVSEMLERLGYEVEQARNGEEAIILYKRSIALSRPFDAVVLDVTVAGGMGGEECILRLRELDPAVRALVMSGYSDEAVLAEYRKHGFREILAKPFTVDELHKSLAKTMMRGESGDA